MARDGKLMPHSGYRLILARALIAGALAFGI